jgi:hypothetical protein
MSPANKITRRGVKAGKRKRHQFFRLVERFRNAADPREAQRLGNKPGRTVFRN